MALHAAFAAALPDKLRARAGEVSEAQLAAVAAGAQAAWPDVRVGAERFVACLAARLAADAAPARSLEKIHAGDLFLACGCIDRDPAALAAFDALLGREVTAAVAQIRGAGPVAADLKQQLADRLIVAGQLAAYGGRGGLRGWLRITAGRDAMRQRRKLDREVPLDEAVAEAHEGAGANPEIERMKAMYRDDFRVCFKEALGALDSKDRNLLRQHFVHGLGIDDLSGLFHVHRATAARWLNRLRAQLVEDTHARLIARLGIDHAELESIMRMVRSQLDISIIGSLEEP